MKNFLHRFGDIVLGVLKGFDRLVLRGKLRQLYSKEGIHCYLSANHVLRKDFTEHAQEVTAKVMQASLLEQAKKEERFQYLNSSQISKEETARAIAAKHPVKEGLVCVLQCVEPCWTFDKSKKDGLLLIRGERGIRNRDLVSALYARATEDLQEKRRRSGQATRLLRLLRAHGLLRKVKNRHLYQVTPIARTSILALLAACDANPDELTSKAA